MRWKLRKYQLIAFRIRCELRRIMIVVRLMVPTNRRKRTWTEMLRPSRLALWLGFHRAVTR